MTTPKKHRTLPINTANHCAFLKLRAMPITIRSPDPEIISRCRPC